MGEGRRFRIRRRWFFLVLLPVAVYLLGRALVPHEELRALVIEEISEATGAEVTLGDSAVRFLPGLGVRLDGGSIVGTGAALEEATGAPSKIEHYEIRLDRFDVDLAVFPLLGGGIRITSIVARGPVMALAWEDEEARLEDFELDLKNVTVAVESARAAVERASDGIPPGEVIPADLMFDLEARVRRVTAQQALYEELMLAGDFAGRVLTVPDFSVRRGPGEITGRFRVDYHADPHGLFNFEANAAAVPAEILLAPWAADLASRLEGPLDVEASGSFAMRDQATVLRTLAVQGGLTGGPGILHAGDWLQEASPYLGRRQDLKDVDFRTVSHEFHLDKGRYHLDGLTFRGGQTDWVGSGWIDLFGRLDLALSVKLPPGFVPDLGQWSFLAGGLKDDDDRIGLSFTLEGRTERPSVALDMKTLFGAGR